MPALQGSVKFVPAFNKFNWQSNRLAFGGGEHRPLEAVFRPQITFRNRPRTMQRLDQLGRRDILVLFSGLGERRGSADLALQFGGSFQGFAALLVKDRIVFEKLFLRSLDF